MVLSSKRMFMEIGLNDPDISRANEKTGRKWAAEELVQVVQLSSDRASRSVYLLLVLLEIVAFVSVIVVGTKYLLVQETVSNLVQACVAIVFLNDIDNLAFNALMPEAAKTILMAASYELPYLRGEDDDGGEHAGIKDFFYFASLLGATPIIVCTSVGIVYGMHNSFC